MEYYSKRKETHDSPNKTDVDSRALHTSRIIRGYLYSTIVNEVIILEGMSCASF